MTIETKKLGIFGENIAKEFLKNKGFKIIKSNFYTKYGEIDIICSKNNKLFFVEVKSRSYYQPPNYPENAVNFEKKIKMSRAAQIFLNKNKIFNIFFSFSVIAITINQQKNIAKIKFFEKV